MTSRHNAQSESKSNDSRTGIGRRRIRIQQQIQRAVSEALEHFIRLLIAVTCCMTFVVTFITLDPSTVKHKGQYLLYTPFAERGLTPTQRTTNSVVNALIFLSTIIIMTCVMVTIFYFRYYKVLKIWIALSVSSLLFVSSAGLTDFFATMLNMPMDLPTVLLFLWNFEVLGLASVFGKGPLVMQQAFLVVLSAFASMLLTKLIPEWTMWWILCLIPIWDLVAVLCTYGPLRVLLTLAENREVKFGEGMLFSTGAADRSARKLLNEASPRKQDKEKKAQNELPPPQPPPTNAECDSRRTSSDVEDAPASTSVFVDTKQMPLKKIEPVATQKEPKKGQRATPRLKRPSEQGLQMGLGDFVFYSILVGKVAVFWNWSLTVACALCVLVGICLTIGLLVICGAALPALPLSLTLGLICVALNSVTEPFTNALQEFQVYI